MKKAFVFALFLILSAGITGAQNLPRLAVVEFSTNDGAESVKKDAVLVRNQVEAQIIASGKYQVIVREEIDKLLANQQIQASSISSDENVKKLRLLNISYIVTGTLDTAGNSYALTVKLLDVSSGRFLHSESVLTGKASQELYHGVTGLVNLFVSGIRTDGDRVEQTEAVYRVGDFKVNFSGDILSERERQLLTGNLRQALGKYNVPMEVPGESEYTFTISNYNAQTGPTLIRVEFSLELTRNRQIIAQAGPYVVTEINRDQLVRREGRIILNNQDFFRTVKGRLNF
jgi:TolB-like protein